MKNPVIFFDKDGTLIKDHPYNVDPDKIVLEKGAVEGLQRLSSTGYRFVIVSNQSGVARGYFKEEALQAVKNRLNTLLEQKAGTGLAGFYYCPHYPQGSVLEYAIECDCRKPQPGLLIRAAIEMDIDLNEAWMVGDILNDVEAGNRAGCRTILIDNGHETEWLMGPFRLPDYVAANLEEAAEIILSQGNYSPKRQPIPVRT